MSYEREDIMTIYKKTVTVGKYEFNISVDRDMVADAFDKYPKLLTLIIKYSDGNENPDEKAILLRAIEDGNFKTLLKSNEEIAEIVKYLFPLMLKKADKFYETDNASKSQEILDYIYENEADEVFFSSVFEFIVSVFTDGVEEKKPKVKFVMK